VKIGWLRGRRLLCLTEGRRRGWGCAALLYPAGIRLSAARGHRRTARAQLVGRRIQITAGRANKHIVKELGHLARVTVAHTVHSNVCASPTRLVQARDPRRHPFKQFWFACYGQNGVLSTDRL